MTGGNPAPPGRASVRVPVLDWYPVRRDSPTLAAKFRRGSAEALDPDALHRLAPGHQQP